ncbi:MAG TPA: tRNA pseudouridine(54/55) synthase Pus10 [Candidatus Pacearchaeota archaeon]|nr:tRNA pseudouridine(54/55) synthase Pus10 [Candidatus Pacearchaeota archaeon]
MKTKKIFVKGRYKKFSRDIPQNSPGNKHRTSVADIIVNAGKDLFSSERCLFHAAGREDKDTLMLGSGRPFILEIINPTITNINFEKITGMINLSGDIEVFKLSFCEKEEIKRIKNSKWNKTYQVRVVFKEEISKMRVIEAISTLTGTIISQRTPQRVNDSRPDLVRKKKIIFFKMKNFFKDQALFEIKAESGTYIKELISGDKQRTNPSLSSLLGIKCKVLELDVIGIEDD